MDFKLSGGFFDLCINITEKNVEDISTILSKLYELGYRTVALNRTITENIFDPERKKKKKSEENEASSSIIPEPIDISELTKRFKHKISILTRITFICSDPAKTHTLAHSAILKKYNLYSVVPKTQAALHFACSQLNADLISINVCSSGLKLNRKLYSQALERGLHFEVYYADFMNTDTRKSAIQLSHSFYIYGKSKNVIVSSGATNASAIRNPYDIINLASLMGLNEVRSKACMLWQCKNVLLRAERRRHGKAIISIEFLGSCNINNTDDDRTNVKKIKVQ